MLLFSTAECNESFVFDTLNEICFSVLVKNF
jgi:hypothetical protein